VNTVRRKLLWLLVGTSLAGAVVAQTPATEDQSGVAWAQLNPQQQKVLKNFQQHWETLPPEQQRKLSDGAARWRS